MTRYSISFCGYLAADEMMETYARCGRMVGSRPIGLVNAAKGPSLAAIRLCNYLMHNKMKSTNITYLTNIDLNKSG